MSSQILSNKHFNTIESNLIVLANKNEIYFYPQDINRCMTEMRLISIRSYFKQYKHHYNNGFVDSYNEAEKDIFKTSKVSTLTLKGLYNAMRSVMYQIELTDDEMTQTELKQFRIFKSMLAAISYNIISPLINEKTSSNTWSI